MTFVDAVAQSLMAGCDFSDKEFQDNIPAAVRDWQAHGGAAGRRLDPRAARAHFGWANSIRSIPSLTAKFRPA